MCYVIIKILIGKKFNCCLNDQTKKNMYNDEKLLLLINLSSNYVIIYNIFYDYQTQCDYEIVNTKLLNTHTFINMNLI